MGRSQDAPEPVTAVDAALAALRADVDALAVTPVGAVDPAQLATRMADLHRQIERLRGTFAVWTGAFSRAGGPRATGHRDTQSFLQQQLRQAPAEAKKVGDTARHLQALPDTAAALADGTITFDQAATIGRTADELARLSEADDQLARAEDRLLRAAATSDAGQLARAGRALVREADRNAAAADAAHAHQQRTLTLTDDGRGSTFIEGRVTSTVGAKLRRALEPHARPAGPDDDRTTGQRAADALEVLLERPAAQPALEGVGDRLGGVLVVAPVEALRPGGPDGLLDGRQPIPANVVQSLACELGVSLLLTDPDGIPLWLGHQVRYATDGQRAALLARDGGCRWPGCTATALMTLAHHVDHDPETGDPGPTDLHRLVLLCPYHHNQHHHAGWRLDLDDRATITVTAPAGASGRAETAAEARRRHAGAVTSAGGQLRTGPHVGSESRGTYGVGADPPVSARVASELRGTYRVGADPPTPRVVWPRRPGGARGHARGGPRGHPLQGRHRRGRCGDRDRGR